MYQITITISTTISTGEEAAETAVTTIGIRTLQDMSEQVHGHYATSMEAAELGTALAWSGFVRRVAGSTQLVVKEPATDIFEEVVEHYRGTVINSLIDGAAKVVREYCGLTESASEPEPFDQDIDWKRVFESMAKNNLFGRDLDPGIYLDPDKS